MRIPFASRPGCLEMLSTVRGLISCYVDDIFTWRATKSLVNVLLTFFRGQGRIYARHKLFVIEPREAIFLIINHSVLSNTLGQSIP